MTVYLQDPDVTIYNGDALDVLRELPDESVDCCITSPPYFGLRDYGTGTWEGGDEGCDHLAPPTGGPNPERYTAGGGEMYRAANDKPYSDTCGKCGAHRIDNQLGLEATPSEYVARMVEVFREVRRVLCQHGSVWLNMGDSFASSSISPQGMRRADGSGTGEGSMSEVLPPYGPSSLERSESGTRSLPSYGNLKPKDLVGMPWRVAFALQADGWYLRSDIVWAKPNPMPESVTDRPTKAHEMVFLLTKAPRYYYDAEGIREPYRPDGRTKTLRDYGTTAGAHENHQGMNERERWPATGANARDWWLIPTQPFPEAHFATFPEELVRRCLLAGCPEDGTVLDPFMGSGTTALVARKHNRRAIGIELSEPYCAIAAKRLAQQSLFAETA